MAVFTQWLQEIGVSINVIFILTSILLLVGVFFGAIKFVRFVEAGKANRKAQISELQSQNEQLQKQINDLKSSSISDTAGNLELANIVLSPDMGTAIEKGLSRGATRIQVYSYVGNFLTDALRKTNKESLAKLEVQFICKNPHSTWQHPPDGSKQANERKQDILKTIAFLSSHHNSVEMSHRVLAKPQSEWIRFFKHEPTHRLTIMDFKDGGTALYVGLYDLKPRLENIDDYTGTGSGVICIEKKLGEENNLVDTAVRWFNHTWLHSGKKL